MVPQNKTNFMTTYSALYYHLIWSNKERSPLITESVKSKLHAYLTGIVQEKKGIVIQVGGMPDIYIY